MAVQPISSKIVPLEETKEVQEDHDTWMCGPCMGNHIHRLADVALVRTYEGASSTVGLCANHAEVAETTGAEHVSFYP